MVLIVAGVAQLLDEAILAKEVQWGAGSEGAGRGTCELWVGEQGHCNFDCRKLSSGKEGGESMRKLILVSSRASPGGERSRSVLFKPKTSSTSCVCAAPAHCSLLPRTPASSSKVIHRMPTICTAPRNAWPRVLLLQGIHLSRRLPRWLPSP
jgi:hypothetical protein